jgi:hypothetical protein
MTPLMTELSDWADFLAFASHRSDGVWLFRAETASGASSAPGQRPAVGWMSTDPTFDKVDELNAFETFVASASPFVDGADHMSRLDWLRLAHDHGLPTRLLVWTGNPLAALARAIRHAPDGSDIDLRAVRVPRDRRVREIDPFEASADVSFVAAPSFEEQDVVSIHGRPEQDWIPAQADLPSDSLRIPAGSRTFFESRLRVFGQNGSGPRDRLTIMARDVSRGIFPRREGGRPS